MNTLFFLLKWQLNLNNMYGTIFVNENIQSDKNDKGNLRCLFFHITHSCQKIRYEHGVYQQV